MFTDKYCTVCKQFTAVCGTAKRREILAQGKLFLSTVKHGKGSATFSGVGHLYKIIDIVTVQEDTHPPR